MKLPVILVIFLVAVFGIVLFQLALRPPMVWHVTCPYGVYDGDIQESWNGRIDVETGQRIRLPDNCAWVRLK